MIPAPGVDVGADIGLLLEMIPTINKMFGLTPEQIGELDSETQQIVFFVITKSGSELAGRLITRQLGMQILKSIGVRITTKPISKYIPIIGQTLAVSISFGAMKLIKNSHIDCCYEIARKAIQRQTTEQTLS